jgi:hypothetical protein
VAVSLKSVAFPSPVERIAEPAGVVYACVVLRRPRETSEPLTGPYLDTRVFSLGWPKTKALRGWVPVPDAPTEVIEGVDADTGELVVMARRAFHERRGNASAELRAAADVTSDEPDVWARDGQRSVPRPDDDP